MAFKIVNGKLVKITDQSDFGTPEQKRRGRRITGTLGVISGTKTPARRIEEVFSPPKPSSKPSGPIIRESDFGPKAQEGFDQGALSAPTPRQPPAVAAFIRTAVDAGASLLGGGMYGMIEGFETTKDAKYAIPLLQRPADILALGLKGSAEAVGASFAHVKEGINQLGGARSGQGAVPTGTLGLENFQSPGNANQPGPGSSSLEQRRLRTLNNPRTLGEFEYIGALPSIQQNLAAYLLGQDVNPAFVRFFFNQGLVEETDEGLQLTGEGQRTMGQGSATRTIFSRAPIFSGQPGRFSGTRGASIGLTNWRI